MTSIPRKELLAKAFLTVRDRFAKASCLTLPKQGSEYEVVQARANLLFDNTVLGGKNARSLLSITAFDALCKDASEHERSRMAETAVTIEMIQSFYLIIDDIMDMAETRRGKTCWYKRPEIGLAAINDGLMLDAFIDDIIEETMAGHPNRSQVARALRKSKRKTTIGQLLDATSVNDFENFTWDRYEHLVEYKTSDYTFHLPLVLATLVADNVSHGLEVETVAHKIGFLFQSQDDILDIFGDPKTTGKIGTDIQDGKCTWASVRAMQLLQKNDDKLRIFKENYGKHDLKSVTTIRSLFADDLKLKLEFERFENRFAEGLIEDILSLPLVELQPVLLEAVNKMIRRQK